MVERKLKFTPPGSKEPVDGVEVSVDSANEKWSEYTLEDGTKIRLRQALVEVTRGVGMFDPEGNPMYFIKAQPIINIVEVPERLKRKAGNA